LIPLFYPLLALILMGIGAVFGAIPVMSNNDNINAKPYQAIMLIFMAISIAVAVITTNQMDDERKQMENITKKQIESMSCTQLHDALLHNTINGTEHIQRATERYVAGCETK